MATVTDWIVFGSIVTVIVSAQGFIPTSLIGRAFMSNSMSKFANAVNAAVTHPKQQTIVDFMPIYYIKRLRRHTTPAEVGEELVGTPGWGTPSRIPNAEALTGKV